MTTLTIRDVPEATRDELAARAARTGRSMQEYVRALLIRHGERPSQEDVLARLRGHASVLPALDRQDLLDAIAADRR